MLDPKHEREIEQIVYILYELYKRGNTVYVFGNGGSLSDASHIASDAISLGKGYEIIPIRIIPLTDPNIITALANDYGYERVYENWIKAWCREGDAVLAISTSGESSNIVEALTYAREKGITTIGLLGRDGGRAKQYCDISMVAPGGNAMEIQNYHREIYHEILKRLHSRILGQ